MKTLRVNGKYIIAIFLFLLLLSVQSYSKDNDLEKNVRTFVNLLDYIATDYHNAVENGKISSSSEYSEMTDFIERAESVFDDISFSVKTINPKVINQKLNELSDLIKKKAEMNKVSDKANNIKLEILSLNIIEISPLTWPSLSDGKKIFTEYCTGCHGEKGGGNGPLSINLNPRPANFLNDTLMRNISSFQIYNTIHLGVSGTSMPAFDKLNDKQVWAAAFYVNSLRYQNKYKYPDDSLKRFYKEAANEISLDQMSTLSDNKLIKFLKKYGTRDSLYLCALRLHEPQKNSLISITKAATLLNESFNLYNSGDKDIAYDKALSAYLEGIEPYEQQLASVNSDLKNQIEMIMTKIRNDIKEKKSPDEIKSDMEEARQLINEASSLLTSQSFSFWFSFFLAASILLREGLEAFLIIATILGVLKSLKAKQASKWVHGGWIAALIIGIISMFFTNMLIAFGAQSRELMEGLGSLIAVIMLLYIGFWLHSKTEAKKWKEFVEGKIVRMIEGNNMWGLAVISFIVVFREAFESAIFLTAVNIEADQNGRGGVYFGAVSALIIVLILSWIAVRFAARLPVRKLFQYSALTMAVLSVVLIGKGIHALQESGYSTSTLINSNVNFSWLGVYPTMETIISQLIVLLLTVILWRISGRATVKIKNVKSQF